MVAGIELKKHATGDEMLNQQSLVAAYNFAASLFGTAHFIFKPFWTLPAGSSPKVVILQSW